MTESFSWGVATSAYQIEGARYEGGKGESIWDRFSDDRKMKVSGDVTCDHYHRLEDDLDLLADLGVDAYRFSVAWTRIMPSGEGPISSDGLDFYSRLIDGLVERDIEPWLTLYHWDLPQALQDRGGWASRNTANAFARYAGVVADAFGDRVHHWITQNEPWVAAYLGHLYGEFAPGISDWPTALDVGHNLLLSHGRAVEAIRESAPGSSVGIALDCRPARPNSESAEDREAARHFDGFRNRWFFDPVFGKGYPEDMLRAYFVEGRTDDLEPAFIRSGDMDQIATPIDFLGLNYYTTLPVAAGAEERDDPESLPGRAQPDGFTEMGWAIDPDGLADYLGEIHRRYRPKSIVVTENGASFSDAPDSDDVIADSARVDYLRTHVDAVRLAAEAGVPVDGYFVWSLLDNLEWTQGFDQRFGLVWVDQQTLQRIPKESFAWYREVVAPESEVSVALEAARAVVARDVGIRLVVDSGGPEMSEHLERWMDGYVLAWSTSRADQIAALFSPEAIYDPQTADGELHGIDEIVAWWQGTGDDPDGWDFAWLPVVETDEVAVVSGTTKYSDPPTSYRNLFIIKWGDDQRCIDFTEWYIEEDA